MSEPYIGEIIMFAGNFAPRGWALCNGQLLSIAQNSALFSILGTTYGGDGHTTFALPDLRGRVPMQPGAGPGLTPHSLGESSGSETVTLLSPQMPAHTHAIAAGGNATSSLPASNLFGATTGQTGEGQPVEVFGYAAGTPTTMMSPQALSTAGGSQPHANMQPYLCVNFIIATEGIFPPRD
jgi:microcystin-dependent protein